MTRFVLLLWLASAAFAQSAPQPQEVDEMLASLSRITGWPVKHKVPTEKYTREKFAKLIEENVRDAEHDKDTRAAELTLKMLGLVPWEFNLARESADLLEEQTAAFYDYKKKRLVVLDEPKTAKPIDSESADENRRVALAHELAHALADQQFGLQKYMEAAKEDDAATARQAVVEGQAHWLSWAYLSELATGRPEVPSELLNQLSNIGMTGDDFPKLTGTPLYMRESLLFPYTEGMRFQDALFRQFGRDAFTRVFRDAPLSTQEILHPKEYADNVVPTHPKPPAIEMFLGKDSGQWKRLTDGDAGEFDYSALLRQYGKQISLSQPAAREIASHWRGAAFALYENKKTQKNQAVKPLLLQSSEWETPAAARAFFEAYLKVMQAKWKNFQILRMSPDEVTGTGDTGDFSLRISKSVVQSVEGLPVGTEAAKVK